MIIFLTISIIVSLLKFGLTEHILKLLGSNGKKELAITVAVMIYLISYVIIGGMVIISLKIGVPTFLASLVGSFLLVLVIMINAITEALGITRNNFGLKVK